MATIMALNVAIFILFLTQDKKEKELIFPWKPPVESIKEEPTPIVNAPAPVTYEEALKQANDLKKPLFVFFHANWCEWCKKMEKETLTDPEVKKALEKYVFISVDFNKNPEIVKKYGGGRLPMYLIDNNGTIKKQEGYKTPTEFLSWLGVSSSKIENKPENPEKPRRGIFDKFKN